MENKQDKGFTLVELLIVIVILGILATVTVFAVRGITDRGQDNACDVEGRTLDTAVEAYYAQNQTDPGDVNALTGGSDPLLKEAPDSAKWTFVAAGTNVAAVADDPATPDVDESAAAYTTTSAEFVGTGKCAGF
jgi:general secretion pathway protein G